MRGLCSLLMITQETVLDVWRKFSSIFGGAILGLFLVGIIVRKATSSDAILGAIAGVLVIVWSTTFPHVPAIQPGTASRSMPI